MEDSIHSDLYMIKTSNSILDKLENKDIITEEEYRVLETALAINLIAPKVLGDQYNHVMEQAKNNIRENDGNYPKFNN